MLPTTVSSMTSSQHDFDFIFGHWSVRNRKLVDTTDPACDQWVEFDAVQRRLADPVRDRPHRPDEGASAG